jgi:ATP-dependent DNA helicase RecG
VTGLTNAKKLLEDIPNKVRDILGIMVDVNLRYEDALAYLEIVVEAQPCPVNYRGEYHYRSGSTKQELKGAALDTFLLKKQGLTWDGVPVPHFTLPDCNEAALNFFKKQAIKSGRMNSAILHDTTANILHNLRLWDGRFLKRAAALLFADDPETIVPGAYIKIGFFVTDDDLRYQDEVHGNLFEQIEKTLDILNTKYLKAYIRYEGLLRVEEALFPAAALREALLNAVVHKDYSSAIPIQISVYEHQIVVWNSGRLPENWTLGLLLDKHPSNPYNPLLAATFFRADYIEAWGRGIEKMAMECAKFGMKPPLYDDMAGLMLTFRASRQRLIEAIGAERATLLTQNWGNVGRDENGGDGDNRVGDRDNDVGDGDNGVGGGGDNGVVDGDKRVGGGDNDVGDGDNKVGDGGDNRVGDGDNDVGNGDNRVGDGDNDVGDGDNRVGDGGDNRVGDGGDNRVGDGGDNRVGDGGKRVGDDGDNRVGVAQIKRTEIAAAILVLLRQMPELSIRAIATRLNVSARQVETLLAHLKAQGQLVRLGSGRRGVWQVAGGQPVAAPGETQAQILVLLQTKPNLTASQLAGQLGISVRKTEQHLAKLKISGRLLRLGTPRSGHWQVVEPD